MDEYGTQQPIALLKLLLEKGYLYDRGKELNCKSIRDLGFIAAMGKAGGGRNEVDPRFLSLFSVFNVPFPSEESLRLIYYSILKGHTSVTGLSPPVLTGGQHVGWERVQGSFVYPSVGSVHSKALARRGECGMSRKHCELVRSCLTTDEVIYHC